MSYWSLCALEWINHWSSWSEAHGQDTPKWSRTVVRKLQSACHIHCSIFLQIKFYWKTVTLICAYIVCGFICTKLTELNSDNRGPVIHKAKNIYYLPLSRKTYCQVLAFIWPFYNGHIVKQHIKKWEKYIWNHINYLFFKGKWLSNVFEKPIARPKQYKIKIENNKLKFKKLTFKII